MKTDTNTTAGRNEIVRGYEVVNGLGVSVMRFKPTIWGAKACAAAVKWLAERHPRNGYEMRALVSLGAPQPEAPLVLEADAPVDGNATGGPDALKSTEQLLAEARVANGEYDVVEPLCDCGLPISHKGACAFGGR